MRKVSKGHLMALLAMAALTTGKAAAAPSNILDLPAAPTEQKAAYHQAVANGSAGLIKFMQRYPTSRLVPAVTRALAEEIGVGAAIQAALNARVPTGTVLALVAELSPTLGHATAQSPSSASGASASAGQY
jgi:hypothetical protein